MPLSLSDARDVTKDLLAERRRERQVLDPIRAYMCGTKRRIYSPKKTTAEYRQIVEMSKVNVFPLIVSTFAQNLFIEGYRPAKGKADNTAAWALWQDNRMDQRQSLIYRSALTYGLSYATVLKKAGGGALMTPYSPLDLTAAYADVVNDEWPIYAICIGSGYDAEMRRKVQRVDLYDDQWRYRFVRDGNSEDSLRYVEPSGDEATSGAHGLPVCPVVRYVNAGQDLDDGPRSEVAPLIPEQDQLDQTTYALLIAQQFGAWRQRTVTGLAIQEDASGNPREPFNVGVDRLLQVENADAKFSTMEATDLGPYLDSRQSTLRIITALAQMAPHALLVSDGVSNLSAEALAALESAQQRKIGEMKTSFGESAEQMLRLASYADGDEAGWEDTSAQVVWRDTESRSLAQVADGWGKIAQMLGVPPQEIWEKLPGVTETDVIRWKAAANREIGLQQQAMAEMSAATAASNAAMMPTMAQGGMNGVVPAGPTRTARPTVPAGA